MDTEELVRLGILRDLRCPNCKSRNLTTIGVFGNISHKCTDCGEPCSDEMSERAGKSYAIVTTLRKLIAIVELYHKEEGDCDHSVGICLCGEKRDLAEAKELLARLQ